MWASHWVITHHDFHETCHSVTFIVLVNSHQRWKQTRNRVCFHLWCKLTLALRCHSIVWNLYSWRCNGMKNFMEFMRWLLISTWCADACRELVGCLRLPFKTALGVRLNVTTSLSGCSVILRLAWVNVSIKRCTWDKPLQRQSSEGVSAPQEVLVLPGESVCALTGKANDFL